MNPIRALVFLLVMAVVAPHVQAQRASLAERVTALEARAANNQGNVDLLNQVNQLKTEVAQLRAQLEELQQQDEQSQRSARSQYLDLDGRLNRLENGAPANRASTPGATPSVSDPSAADPDTAATTANAATSAQASSDSPGQTTSAPTESDPAASDPAAQVAGSSADERASYEAAFDVLKAGRYDESARAFDQFLQQHPDGVYAPNARYWLGESYYVTQNYELALEQFQLLQQRHPDHDKAAGALLKIGLSQYGLKRMDEARATLTQVTETYPGSDAARTAEDRLRAIDLQR